MKLRFPMFFHAPDDGTTVAVPAESSPTGAAIETTPNFTPPPPEIHQLAPVEKAAPEPKVRQPGVKLSKVDVVKEMGLAEAPSDSVKKLAAAQRDKAGRFAPKDPSKMPADQPPVKKETAAAKPVEKKPEVTPPVAGKPEAVAQPEKISIDGKEYTTKELADFIAKGAKPEAAIEPPKVAPTPEETAKTDEEAAAAQAQSESEWLESKVAAFKPETYGIALDEKSLDVILSGGPNAVASFGQMLARVAAVSELNSRKWAAAQLNTIRGDIQPEIDQRVTIQRYQAEGQFLAANPDIAAHKEAGVKAMREAAAELHDQYDALQLAVAQHPNNAWAKTQLEKLEKDFLGEVATAAKAKLAGATPPVATASPAPAKPAPVAKPRPPAPTGNVGVTAGTPKAKGNASSEISELIAAGLS